MIISIISNIPIGVENSGRKYVELINDIIATNNNGTHINTYIIILELPVNDFSSNFNFL